MAAKRSKKPRKSHSRSQRIARAAMRCRMWMRENGPKTPDGRTQWDSNMSFDACGEILSTMMPWYVVVRYFFDDGDEWQYEIISWDKCLLDELMPQYLEIRAQVDKEVNMNRVVDVGWDARPLSDALRAKLKAEGKGQAA